MSPAVSIIMPAFNVEEYICESIESVCRQTFQDWELIIINDGSTDGTYDIIVPFLIQEPRIVYYKQANQGVAATRNQGMFLARGELIAFLDADDLWAPFFLQKLIAAQAETKADGVCAYSNQLTANGTIWEYPTDNIDLNGNMLMQFLRKEIVIHINSFVLEKKVLFEKELRFTNGCIMGEDTEFKCKVLAACNIQCLPEVLITYRQRPGSVTHQKWHWSTYMNSIRAFERGVAYIRENYRGNNPDLILNECWRQLNFRKYLYLHFMIRNKYLTQLQELLKDQEWKSALTNIRKGKFDFSHRIRACLILTRQKWLWRCFVR